MSGALTGTAAVVHLHPLGNHFQKHRQKGNVK